ncbi:substrate-binding domain-containing protein [Halomonas sp. HMF6819]|uniref:substrate-binding domain-containing protein n=1 Tax=unclassified Halomonas TaxID=2609666 RepID=UPI002076B1DE|nr:substrate-binding domain-containing protein [Halomonas sp. S3-1-8]
MASESPKRPTIYDLARLANASPSTVSAVLNGSWQRRRISQKLADRILSLAQAEGYSANMQARALRRERSGIIGMILPLYDNRYFSSIAQHFEAQARQRGLFAIVACTNRDPEQEREAARMMLAYRVECLVSTGATDPDTISEMCDESGAASINLDLPGHKAPSVISDNREGARSLTDAILDRLAEQPVSGDDILFIGGRAEDHNTRERIAGFTQARTQRGLATSEVDIIPCDYAADKAQAALEAYMRHRPRLPSAMFVNSTISLEGIVRWLQLGGYQLDDMVVGCFDWDPLAAAFHPHLMMVRQSVEVMIARVFEMIDAPVVEKNRCIEVAPEIIGV